MGDQNVFKVVLLGNSGVGKTSLVCRLRGVRHPGYIGTIGVEIHTIILRGRSVDGDITGSPRHSGLLRSHCTGAHAFIVMDDCHTGDLDTQGIHSPWQE